MWNSERSTGGTASGGDDRDVSLSGAVPVVAEVLYQRAGGWLSEGMIANRLLLASNYLLFNSSQTSCALANNEAERHLNPVGLASTRTINAPKEE
jgi:hypothetical protein